MYNEKSVEAITAIQDQINKFDNKANSLITIVSIVFALSLGILETFNQYAGIELTVKLQFKFNLLIAFSILYFIAFAVEMVFLLLVIYPRRKKRGEISFSYYLDATNLTKENIKERIVAERNSELEADVEQIKVNAKICSTKHKYLVIAIWLMIPLYICMFSTFLVAIL